MSSRVLRPKKSSAIWLLFGCGFFVAIGIWMAQEEGWIGYLCAGFFGLGIMVAIVKLIPGSTYLRIAEDGLTFATLFRVKTIPWNVIEQFFVVTMQQTGVTVHKLVGFNYVPDYDRAQALRRINFAMTQCEGALPDTYGKKAEELADLLNRYLAKYTRKDGKF